MSSRSDPQLHTTSRKRTKPVAGETEARAVEAFEEALGFGPPTSLPDRPVFVASFKDLDHWSHEGILRTTLHLEEIESRFPVVELDTVGRVSYGLQKSPLNRPELHPRPYLRVANVQRWRLDLTEIKMIDLPDRDMPTYRLEDGDILLCEGNSAELVGRSAIWESFPGINRTPIQVIRQVEDLQVVGAAGPVDKSTGFKTQPKTPEIARRVKPLARLLLCATALRVTPPARSG